MKPQPPPPLPPPVQPSLQDQLIPSLVVATQRTPPSAGNTTPLIDDLELSAQRNLALARLNSSPIPSLSNTNGGATSEQLYSHLYGSKEIGMMRKMATNMDDYNSSPRSYGLHMQHMPVTPPHHHLNSPDPTSMQQNFSPQAKFNQFNYPNAAGLLKPCYDYPHANQMMHHNQQMKKEMFDLYQTPPFLHQPNAFNHHSQHQQQHPSFNQMNGGLLAKLDNTGDNLNEFNTNSNNTNNINNSNASNKSSDAVLLTRSSILNSNNSNKIEPNNDPLSIVNSGVDDADKLSSPLTTESSLNNEHNDDDNDDGYTVL